MSKETLPRIITSLSGDTEYELPNKGALVAPNETFEDARENHIGFSIKATSSNPYASGVIEGMATNVVGVGFKLQSNIDHDRLGISHDQALEYSKQFESIFNQYATDKSISVLGDKNLHQLANTAYRTQLITGNCFVLLPRVEEEKHGSKLKIKLLDSSYLYDEHFGDNLSRTHDTTEKNKDDLLEESIIRDSNGKIIAYRFYKHNPYISQFHNIGANQLETYKINTHSNIKRNVLHMYDSKRAGQIVALPFISVVATVLQDIGEYTKAEIDASKLNAHFAGFIYNDAVDESGVIPTNDNSDTNIKIGKGNLVKLAQGWKITFADPARPAEHYAGFVDAKIKELCIAINYPFEMFMKLFNTSYTASRGAVIEGQKMFKVKRLSISEDFYQPIYEQIILEEILEGRLHLKGFLDDYWMRKAWLGAEWIADAQEDMNKLASIKASDASVKAGFSTRDREAKLLNGSNYKENLKTSTAESEAIEETKIPYVGEMNPQVIELADKQAQIAKDNQSDRLKDGSKPNKFGDKKQKGDG
jgi:lambda family phage portal protein